jgi:DNA invertase Pin-like site-specific DNA recombinase
MLSNRQFAAALKATSVDQSSHGRGHRNDAEARQKLRFPFRDQTSRDQTSSPLWQDSGATEMHTERKPKAYSYTRFSTPEQAKGDSSTRQALAAERWANEHNVELDAELTFRDEGISAFDGLNVERGALGAFLKAVQSGDVPKGSWLLVESLDRISRQKPRKAARLMEDIVEAGVIVVDLYDGAREYSTEALDNDNFLLVQMVLRFIRANEESEIKAARVAAARRRSRERDGAPHVPNPSELRRNRLLNGLADGDFTRLRANFKNVRLTVGAVLHPVGVPIKHVYFPESGMVSMLTVMKSGELIETAIVGREGVIGGWVAIDGRNANTQSTVQIGGSAWQIPTAKLLEIYKASDAFQSAIKPVSGRHSISGAAKRGLPRYSLY